MKDLIIEKYQKLKSKNKMDIQDIAESLEIILNALYPQLVAMENDQMFENDSILLYLKKRDNISSTLDSVEGFIDIKKDKLEMQYHGADTDEMAAIVLSKQYDGDYIGAFIVNGDSAITIFNDKIVINDGVVSAFPLQSTIIEKARVVTNVIEKSYSNSDEHIHTAIF